MTQTCKHGIGYHAPCMDCRLEARKPPHHQDPKSTTSMSSTSPKVLQPATEESSAVVKDSLTTELAQPEQEPVAWLDGPHLVIRADWSSRMNWKGPWVDLGRAIPHAWEPVLYATPPQHDPLTISEDDAWDLAQYIYARSNPHDSPQILLSAMELKQIIEAAANGIKGEA